LKDFLGDEYEEARLNWKLSVSAAKASSSRADLGRDSDATEESNDEKDDEISMDVDANSGTDGGNHLHCIHGKVPKNLMQDGENVQVGDYKLKRTQDHYYCTCPAWRMQNNPVDGMLFGFVCDYISDSFGFLARSCKHLKTHLGDEYEEARIQWKDPHRASAKGSKRKLPWASASPSSSPAKVHIYSEPILLLHTSSVLL
jgi:DNA ligase-1